MSAELTVDDDDGYAELQLYGVVHQIQVYPVNTPGIVDTHVLLLEASSIGGEASALLTQEDVDALASYLDRFRTPAEA